MSARKKNNSQPGTLTNASEFPPRQRAAACPASVRGAADNVPMAIRTEVTVGTILAAVGVAAMTGAFRALEHFSYPVIWWGVLLWLDAWNRAGGASRR